MIYNKRLILLFHNLEKSITFVPITKHNEETIYNVIISFKYVTRGT